MQGKAEDKKCEAACGAGPPVRLDKKDYNIFVSVRVFILNGDKSAESYK